MRRSFDSTATWTIAMVLAVLVLVGTARPAEAGWPFGRKCRDVPAQPCQVAIPGYGAGYQAVHPPTASVAPAVPTGQVVQAAQPVAAAGGDAYGFVGMLNAARARMGLPPVAYDPGLESWASSNNAAQMARGMGHWISCGTGQCSAVAFDAATALSQWSMSPAHAAILFNPAATVCGFSVGGGYATANVGG